MPAGAASRYALGADGAGAARPAPAASLISASRYALGARRTALRAEGAARLCAKRRSRWLPSPPRATRSPPRAWALRARAPAAAFSPPRATRSAPNAWALRARAPTCCSPPDNCARCLLVVGTSKTSCASRCSRRSVQGALRAPAEGEGGEGWSRHHHARAFGERLCAAAACAVRVGAERRWDRSAFPPGQADPPRFQRACSSASRWSGAHTSALRAGGGRPRKGVRRIIDPRGLGSQR